MLPLIDGVAFDGLIADMAFHSNAIVTEFNQPGAKLVIAQHPLSYLTSTDRPRSTNGAT
jgi:hypothetical protein